MDRQLANRLNALTKQNEKLAQVRSAYLLLEAERKHREAVLIRRSEGKSQAERTTVAHSTTEWLVFQRELAELESAYEFEKLKYEILDKAWTSEYGTYKIEEGLIRKHKGI